MRASFAVYVFKASVMNHAAFKMLFVLNGITAGKCGGDPQVSVFPGSSVHDKKALFFLI